MLVRAPLKASLGRLSDDESFGSLRVRLKGFKGLGFRVSDDGSFRYFRAPLRGVRFSLGAGRFQGCFGVRVQNLLSKLQGFQRVVWHGLDV